MPEPLESRHLLAAAPIISEFMANNASSLADGNGANEDWIELYNAGDQAIDLAGWHLTDDAAELDKWTFPGYVIEPGEFKIVFASGQLSGNYVDPAGYLHTNFKLNDEGEYLALVHSDGATIQSEFGPAGIDYPNQREDVSYGQSAQVQTDTLITKGDAAQYLVPTSDALANSWTQTSFVPDPAWTTGPTAIGYDVNDSSPTPGGGAGIVVLSVDFNARANPGQTQPGFQSFVANASGIRTEDVTRTFGPNTVTVRNINGSGYDDRVRADPLDAGSFNQSALLRDFIFSRDLSGVGGLDVVVTGLTPGQSYSVKLWSLDEQSNGTRVSDWLANGAAFPKDYTFNGLDVPPAPSSNDKYTTQVTTVADASGAILISGRRDVKSVDAANAASFGVFLNALQITTADPPPLLQPLLELDFNKRAPSNETGAADTEPGFQTMTLDQNFSTFNGIKVSLNPMGNATLDDRDRNTPAEIAPRFTHDQLYDDFIFASGGTNGDGLEMLLEGLTPGQQYDVTLWSYDSGSAGARQSTWVEVSSGTAVTLDAQYAVDGTTSPTQNGLNTIHAQLTASAAGTLRIQGNRVGGPAGSAVFLNALRIAQPGLGSAVTTDIESAMHGVNSTAYVRIPFTVPAGADYDILKLGIQYDDGFVAYLNGQEVVRRNAPGAVGLPPSFDAAATAEHPNTAALAFEEINLTALADLLLPGQTNVLAIHGLNLSATDGDFLITPRLVATEITPGPVMFFPDPTPGAPNEGGVIGFVDDTEFSIDRGFFDAPFDVEIVTATPGATIIYTLDGSEPAVGDNGAIVSGILYTQPIHIATTSFLRAVAVTSGYGQSNVDAQTYVFLNDVLQQNPPNGAGQPYPATWSSSGGTFPADYAMDPEVVAAWPDIEGDGEFGIKEGLTSIPTMSIVMPHNDWWNSSTGIYTHPEARGSAWERPASIEYFDPTSGESFHVNAGIQVHGEASRDFLRTPKKSFRLLFTEEFGMTELDYPFFKDTPVDQHNSIVLRAFFTDSFSTRTVENRYSPISATYMKDVWMRDSQLDMGHFSAHSNYVHLYINGLYWGLYDPAERPDDAFMAAHLGGDRDNYDVLKDFNELASGNRDAWNQMFALANAGLASDAAYQQIQGNNPDGSPNPALPNYLDVDSLIDYMILHIYAGAEDWPHHNWYAARDRVGETTGFKFFAWDQEIVLDAQFRDRTDVENDFTPARLYSKLRENPEFRLRFADHVNKLLFNGGALSTPENQARWMERADEIEAAIIGESARWGDYREGETGEDGVIVPTMTLNQWRAERNKVRDVYFPQNHSLTISRLSANGLYPSLAAPQFSQHGGNVVAGFDLSISSPAGAIYYTLDGSDPRATGGAVSGGATTFSQPIDLTSTTVVKSRVLNGGVWSALTEALFTVDTPLRVSEIMYNPLGSDDGEFIELINVHPTETVDLTGARFSLDGLGEGIEYEFLASDALLSLGPGQYIVIVKDRAAFSALHPDVPAQRIADRVFAGSLANEGESITLLDAGGGTIQNFAYRDDWYPSTDNDGRSLVIIDPLGALTNWSLQTGWRPSGVDGGSPGAVDIDPVPTVDIVDVDPDPRSGPIDTLQFTFSEPVSGFDVADLSLSRNGGPNLLSGAQTLQTSDGVHWNLLNLSSLTKIAGQYTVTLTAAGSQIVDGLGQLLAGNAFEDFVVRSTIAGRHVFYNQSKFDGNSAAANASDDAAIATDKVALLPGGTASFANYASFNRGLNGIMVDIVGLPNAGVLSASDFEFKVGNSDTPSAWVTLAAAPTITVRTDAGVAGSDRVTLVWATGAAIKQWLQVTVKANGNTGLTAPDVFYFGNAVGESGNVVGDYSVSITDELLARNNPVSINPGTTVINRFDYNRDGTVSVVDQLLARNNITTAATKLKQIVVPSALSGSGLVAQGLDDSSDIARGLSAGTMVSSSSTSAAGSSSRGSTSSSSRLRLQALSAAYGEGESLVGKRRTASSTNVDNELLELLASGT